MSTTTVAASVRAPRSKTQVIRFALITLAIVAFVAVSFVLGRATAPTSSPAPAIAPAANAPSTDAACRLRQPC